MPKLTFDAQIRRDHLINIPLHLRRIHDIKSGDWWKVTIEKLEPKKK